MKRRVVWIMAGFVAPAFCADTAAVALGQKEEARNCTACHSVRLIHSQRLTKAAWNRELDKMSGWSAAIENREALLEYLVTNFGDDKAPPAPTLTRADNGSPAAPQPSR